MSTLGRYFFATALLGSGVQQVIIADFVRLVPKLPAWVPWHPFWACVVGVVLIAAGLAIGLGIRVRLAAMVAGALLVASFLFQRVPEIAANPWVGFVWTNPCKVLALWGGTLLLAGNQAAAGAGGLPVAGKLAERFPAACPLFLGIFLLVCGVQHFVYAGFVQTLVPAWIPPGRLFWTCFTGVALMAGGTGILLPQTMRWAAGWSGLMIFLWVILLHLPRALAVPYDPGETSAVFEALALSGVAFVVAGTGPGVPATGRL